MLSLLMLESRNLRYYNEFFFLLIVLDSYIQIKVRSTILKTKQNKTPAFENFSCQNSQTIPSHECPAEQCGWLNPFNKSDF